MGLFLSLHASACYKRMAAAEKSVPINLGFSGIMKMSTFNCYY